MVAPLWAEHLGAWDDNLAICTDWAGSCVVSSASVSSFDLTMKEQEDVARLALLKGNVSIA